MLQLSRWMALGWPSPSLSFLICKIGLLVAPTSQAARWSKVFSKCRWHKDRSPPSWSGRRDSAPRFLAQSLFGSQCFAGPAEGVLEGSGGEAEPLWTALKPSMPLTPPGSSQSSSSAGPHRGENATPIPRHHLPDCLSQPPVPVLLDHQLLSPLPQRYLGQLAWRVSPWRKEAGLCEQDLGGAIWMVQTELAE